ncbi:Zn(2)-C6 fungal-type domain-containing protein [Plasmodiophora brassicae]|nr:hypothetical protein PBRA_009060 [Plasmodiophora brassicae]
MGSGRKLRDLRASPLSSALLPAACTRTGARPALPSSPSYAYCPTRVIAAIVVERRKPSTRSRAGHACLPCSQAKARCDEQRPCGRCLARGMEDQCVSRVVRPRQTRARSDHVPNRACAACRHAKVSCTSPLPCSRCVRLGCDSQCAYPPSRFRGGRHHHRHSDDRDRQLVAAASPCASYSSTTTSSSEPVPLCGGDVLDDANPFTFHIPTPHKPDPADSWGGAPAYYSPLQTPALQSTPPASPWRAAYWNLIC